MSLRVARRRYSSEPYIKSCGNLGTYEHDVARRNASSGSSQLRDALEAHFIRFERRHHLKRGEGKILLLDTGVRG